MRFRTVLFFETVLGTTKRTRPAGPDAGRTETRPRGSMILRPFRMTRAISRRLAKRCGISAERRLHREACAPFGPAPRKHTAAAGSTAARPEAVRAAALAPFRLIGSLHTFPTIRRPVRFPKWMPARMPKNCPLCQSTHYAHSINTFGLFPRIPTLPDRYYSVSYAPRSARGRGRSRGNSFPKILHRAGSPGYAHPRPPATDRPDP